MSQNNQLQSTKRKRGKRSGRAVKSEELRDIHSRVRGVAVHSGIKSNFTATVSDNAIYFDAEHLKETAETHIVPRQSLTRKYLLGIFPQTVELEPVKSRQLDKVSGKLVEVTDNRVSWRSDRSLLNRIPSDDIGTFKREGAVIQGANRRRNFTTEKEVQLTEKILGPALPDSDFSDEKQ